MTTKTFEEQIAEETHEPTASAFKYVHETLEIAWACARDIFGDLARPEHAFSIYDEMHACYGSGEADDKDTDDTEIEGDECDHCSHAAACHPTEHEQDGVCYQFVPLGEGCDNCSQHKDAHGHDARSNDVCAQYAKAKLS